MHTRKLYSSRICRLVACAACRWTSREIHPGTEAIGFPEPHRKRNQTSRISARAPSTVTYRIRRLRENGIIKKFTISVDWRKLGKGVEAALLITCPPRYVGKVASALVHLEEVIELHTLTGFSDLLAMVTLSDMEEYKDFVEKKLGGIPEIESFRVGIVLEDLKEE